MKTITPILFLLCLATAFAAFAGCTSTPSTPPATTTAAETPAIMLIATTLPATTTVPATTIPATTVPVTTVPQTTVSPATTTAPVGQDVTISLVASGFAFEQETLTVPASTRVLLAFTNKDPGVSHNFALYTDSSAGTRIFYGELLEGPGTTTYTFMAPAVPGTYYFRCGPHPIMHGSFIVT